MYVGMNSMIGKSSFIYHEELGHPQAVRIEDYRGSYIYIYMDRTNSKHHIFLKSKLSTTCHLALNHHRATASEKKNMFTAWEQGYKSTSRW